MARKLSYSLLKLLHLPIQLNSEKRLLQVTSFLFISSNPFLKQLLAGDKQNNLIYVTLGINGLSPNKNSAQYYISGKQSQEEAKRSQDKEPNNIIAFLENGHQVRTGFL